MIPFLYFSARRARERSVNRGQLALERNGPTKHGLLPEALLRHGRHEDFHRLEISLLEIINRVAEVREGWE